MRTLSELLVEVRDAAARFEADRWSGEDCARLAEDRTHGEDLHCGVDRGEAGGGVRPR